MADAAGPGEVTTRNKCVWPKPIKPLDGRGADTVFIEYSDGPIESERGIFDSEEAAVKLHPTGDEGIRPPRMLAR